MTVLTYGTFDLFHKGHLRLIQRAKKLGDKLIIGLSTDDFNREKGKNSYFNFSERKQILSSLEEVNLIIPENSWDQKSQDIFNYKIDILVMGSDWEGKFDYLKPYCSVIYLPRTEAVCTTSIKEEINSANF